MKNPHKPTIEKDGYEIHCGYRIRKLTTKSGVRYQADLGRKSGRHIRKLFTSIKGARKWVSEKSVEAVQRGVRAHTFSDTDRVDAIEALGVLSSFRVNLRTAAHFYAKHHQEVNSTNNFAGVVDEYLTAQELKVQQERIRERTLVDAKNRLRCFVDAWGHLPIGAIEARNVDELLDQNNATGVNRKNYIKYLRGFFSWAEKAGRVESNPAKDVNYVFVPEEMPEIYTPSNVEGLLRKAQEFHPKMVPYFALGFFGGIRPEEIERVKWSEINLEQGGVWLRADQTKERKPRLVKFSDNLAAWLREYRQTDGMVFPVSRSALYRWRKKVHTEAKVPLIQDGARHTYATFCYAKNGIEYTLDQLGHSSLSMIKKHYRKLGYNQEYQAEEYFSIHP